MTLSNTIKELIQEYSSRPSVDVTNSTNGFGMETGSSLKVPIPAGGATEWVFNSELSESIYIAPKTIFGVNFVSLRIEDSYGGGAATVLDVDDGVQLISNLIEAVARAEKLNYEAAAAGKKSEIGEFFDA